MIEQVVYDYLKSVLSVDVYLEVEKNMPNEYVLLERTAGSRSNKLNEATMTAQSYANSLYKSALINEQVKTAMESITDSCDIGSCKLNNDCNFTDTTTKKYRYQAVFNLVF